MANEFSDLILSLSMFVLMFAMGLALVPEDFRRIASAPRAVAIGTVLQLLVMPLVGLGLARAFALPPLLAVGFVVLTACPGGMFSNAVAYLARANAALSITLTASATCITLFTLPAWLRLALADEAVGSGAGAVAMPVAATTLRLALLTIVPVALGMALRAARPGALVAERWLMRLSVVGIVIGVALEASARPDPPGEAVARSLAPVLVYAASALLLGLSIPRLFGIPGRDAVTLALELVVKNTLLGIVLVSQALEFEAVVPILVYLAVQIPVGAGLLIVWRWLAGRGVVDGPRETPVASRGSA